MTQHLTKSLINLRGLSFTSQGITKLALNHGERSLNVAALVIPLQKPFMVEAVIMIHASPQFTLFPPLDLLIERLPFCLSPLRRTISLKRNVGHRVVVCYDLEVICRQVSFVRRHFLHREITPGRFNKPLEERAIAREAIADFDSGNDVSFDAAHQMHLNPFALTHQVLIGVFSLRPTKEATSRKPGRINREVRFNRLQRQTARFNQRLQNGSQRGVFKVAGNRVVMRGSREIALAVRVAQVGHKPSARHAR